MIKKEIIQNLPTSIRDEICKYLKTNIELATRAKQNAQGLFLYSLDEKQRSEALIAEGEANAFSVLLKIFEV